MLTGVAMVNLTVQMSLMSVTVKVGLYCITCNYTYLNILTCREKMEKFKCSFSITRLFSACSVFQLRFKESNTVDK